jgi:sugar lactone lactonase YvrE
VSPSISFVIHRITQSAQGTTLEVTGSSDGTGTDPGRPAAFAMDPGGNLYLADPVSHRILKLSPAGNLTTVAGTNGAAASTDGVGTDARFNAPAGLAFDTAGNLFVSDSAANVIRRIAPDRTVTTIAGTAGTAGSADGIGAAARFNHPAGLAVDDSGSVYVADQGNHTVRKITRDGIVSTVVGTAGRATFAPGLLPGAIPSPSAVAIDGTNLYIALPGGGVAIVRNRP